MIADATFLSDWLKEPREEQVGPARKFLLRRRGQPIHTTIVSVGKVAVLFDRSRAAWEWLAKWTIYRLHPGIVNTAADIDRLLISSGRRLGENGNWIAGFAAYYREPVSTKDKRFKHLPNVRMFDYTSQNAA
jgi:predicted nucleic acid-binding protein